ncbi:YcbK family protein [Cupriavidus pinatubonensis]|uniref:Murein endopeptidase K n=1 Tax=Cupriavidus pinatubonensis TaxID=248026 RepID=A0ABM8WQP5_9BURK|nr:DUF882 domain-containing protein [Cupriavidus pinatubonensis]CAG9169773.1 hypothetical protein LMG23994_01656 [Cupriavidus pinatubonensis]
MSLALATGRRAFLKRSIVAGVAGMGAATISNPLMASSGLLLPEYYAGAQEAAAFWAKPRVLNLFRPSTGEHRVICFWRDGAIDMQGYREACHMLRDVRAGLTVAMDLRLLNLLRGQQGWLEEAYGLREPYQVNSGYRGMQTNESEGGVRDSFHTKAMAADGKYPSLPIEYQGKLIAAFRSGGVGFYINRQKFIHSDVGRVRFWVR